MALQCQMTLNTPSCSIGQSPVPMATLVVYNPNAVAVAVTGIQVTLFGPTQLPINAAFNPPTPAMGPGQTTVAPAVSSINFGPFPIVVGSAGAISMPSPPSLNSAPMGGNPQVAEPPGTLLYVGATVMGSDGSVNEAGKVSLLLYPAVMQPFTLGGTLFLSNGQNMLNGIIMGVL